jgi:predicted glycosyltransferase
MPAPRVLFISGSIGLGHVTRDLAIAEALRHLVPGIQISWLAGDAARDVLACAREPLLPESARYTTGVSVVESISSSFVVNLASPRYLVRPRLALRLLRQFRRDIASNVALVRDVSCREKFDLVVGDETFELALAVARNPRFKTAPFALITDFVGVDAMTRNPFERATVHLLNRGWTALLTRVPPPVDRILFVGEEADVADTTFGLGLPNRRETARRAVQFLGYVCPFNPAEYADHALVRARLGYGTEPLIVCSVGGTSVGAALLNLCAKAYPIIKERLPDVRLVLVCGPRLSASSCTAPVGVETRGYVPRLYEHFAACDLAVVHGGGTTTLELTALRRPFVYFPLEEHFEQQVHVAARLARHGAGVRLRFPDTTAESLAESVLANIGKAVSYPAIPTNGAQRAAVLLSELACTR